MFLCCSCSLYCFFWKHGTGEGIWLTYSAALKADSMEEDQADRKLNQLAGILVYLPHSIICSVVFSDMMDSFQKVFSLMR